MTPPLRHMVCVHALGDCRVLTTLANELLTLVAQRELPELNKKLYFEVHSQHRPRAAREGVNASEPDDMSRKTSPQRPDACHCQSSDNAA